MDENTLHDLIRSDEKQFNLDGLDGLNYHWTYLKTEEVSFRVLKKRGVIMIFGFFSFRGG